MGRSRALAEAMAAAATRRGARAGRVVAVAVVVALYLAALERLDTTAAVHQQVGAAAAAAAQDKPAHTATMAAMEAMELICLRGSTVWRLAMAGGLVVAVVAETILAILLADRAVAAAVKHRAWVIADYLARVAVAVRAEATKTAAPAVPAS